MKYSVYKPTVWVEKTQAVFSVNTEISQNAAGGII